MCVCREPTPYEIVYLKMLCYLDQRNVGPLIVSRSTVVHNSFLTFLSVQNILYNLYLIRAVAQRKTIKDQEIDKSAIYITNKAKFGDTC